jgi:parallel beta-helix repeat protein
LRNNDFSATSVSSQKGIIGTNIASILILNCRMINLGYGISIGSFYIEALIENCFFLNNKKSISFSGTGNLSLKGNKVIECSNGLIVRLYGKIVVKNNTCIDNQRIGIDLSGLRSGEISNNLIEKNKCGLRLSYSEYVDISNNYISYNRRDGICLIKCEYNSIIDNHLERNLEFGVLLNESFHNQIYLNFFIDNNLGGSAQAKERDSNNNTWYDPISERGNYWSDLGEYCYYRIEGYLGPIDIYPLNPMEKCIVLRTSNTNPIILLSSFIIVSTLISLQRRNRSRK